MEVIETPLEGLLVLRPNIYKDDRGHFFESYNKGTFAKAGFDPKFVQDNQSLSQKNVIRGLHFQNPPFAQGKLVRTAKGAVYDIAVDIRQGSSTYGQHYGCELSASNFTLMWIPEGFAHGFRTLEDDTLFLYKCTQVYNKEAEEVILWNDKDLKIDWGVDNPIVSEKDQNAQRFKDFKSHFDIALD